MWPGLEAASHSRPSMMDIEVRATIHSTTSGLEFYERQCIHSKDLVLHGVRGMGPAFTLEELVLLEIPGAYLWRIIPWAQI